MSLLLEMNGVCKTFNPGSGHERTALKSVTLHLVKGDFVTIVGSNGAGKSTLLAAVCGRTAVDRGEVRVDGHDVTGFPQYRRSLLVSLVHQDPSAGTCGSLTVEENMALAGMRGRRRGLRFALPPAARREFAGRLAMLGLGLENRLHERVATLSGGQRQALTLVMATLHAPAVLLLDEHTAALDPATADRILDATRRIAAAQELTVLMVTHNLQQALECGNRTIMMDGGRIVLDLKGQARRAMTQAELLERFRAATGGRQVLSDRTMLA